MLLSRLGELFITTVIELEKALVQPLLVTAAVYTPDDKGRKVFSLAPLMITPSLYQVFPIATEDSNLFSIWEISGAAGVGFTSTDKLFDKPLSHVPLINLAV